MKRTIKNNINTVNYWDNLLKNEKWGEERGSIYKKLFKYFPRKRKITALDIGCAIGHGLNELVIKLNNIKFEGCDFSVEEIRKAKKIYGDKVNFFVHNVYKNNLNKNYDYILFIETLEHLNKPKKIIRKYLEFCNEKILVTVPYKEKKWKEHLYFFDENSFKDIREFKKHFIFGKFNTNQKIILYIFEKL